MRVWDFIKSRFKRNRTGKLQRPKPWPLPPIAKGSEPPMPPCKPPLINKGGEGTADMPEHPRDIKRELIEPTLKPGKGSLGGYPG